MRRTLTFLLLIAGIKVSAQNNYAASLIPGELLPYASAVIRNEEIITEVKEPDNVIYHVKRVITVLNKNGDEKTDLNVFYDNLMSVKYIRGFIYNEFGKVERKISEREFDDEAVSDGFSLFQDDRVKHYSRAVTSYPYTVEFEYEMKVKQSLGFAPWEPQYETNVAVEKSTYTFICKPGFNIRYKDFNLPSKVSLSTDKEGNKIYNWTAANLKARRDEPWSPVDDQYRLKLMIAPEKFYYDKHSGQFTNWQQLGKWEYDDLLTGRTDIPEETAQYIKNLTAGISDPKLKAKKIYEYMQQKTHYISVQVGIGGFQPFLASDVDRQGYGDCKALVNYTRSLLKVAGIDSWYCVVWGDHDEKKSMLTDFASMQGNHIILCLPFKNDTTWLECTAQHLPFGFLGDFTDDRTVLACTPEGGKLLHTPRYEAKDNLVKRDASFVLNDAGELSGEIRSVFRGLEYDDRESMIAKSQTERLKDFKRYYPINNLDIKALDYRQDKSLDPATYENVKLSAREYGAVSGGKFFFSLNSIDRISLGLHQVRNRVNPVYIPHGFTEQDRVTYTLPEGYVLDSEPLNLSIDKAFGNFTAKMTVKGNELVYERKLQLKDGTFNKAVYEDILDFYDKVRAADNYNVTLSKK
ncbi:DUF3857 domain-containing protein [Mucilaginibacter ginsenosidivorans]|uniref:DUF3857 domain-containing protein n=1 Tax=Mucilaginibacter ginsenosidivorans TaxID=398053 RepID=A0A5B8UX20_9SPHI|nr:DUF3857 domain-containing protein [Mucilaginibacter ginsenosidivorans]QEC63523.1 DUF3857 domain-containing protein [Mucilaginibacter ginsenosidivorans]